MKKTILLLLMLVGVVCFVNAQQRMVLIEQFTNSGCPPCAGNTPVVASYVNAHPDSVLMIAYHTSFPYQDSMYFENPGQSNARVAYYNVVGVPRSVVDGNYFSGNLLPTLSSTISSRAAIPPRYDIEFSASTLNNSDVQVSVRFESIDPGNQNEDLSAHVVLVEKNVLKSSYICCAGSNTENEYPWVMRQMLPDADGTTLINKQQGGIDQVTLSHTVNNFKNLSELRVVAFVQNKSTKEIYQSSISDPDNITSVNSSINNGLEFYFENPVKEKELNITVAGSLNEYTFEITNIIGNSILTGVVQGGASHKIDLTDFSNGIYFVVISKDGIRSAQKFIIQ